MIPVTPITDVEQQDTAASKSVAARRQLFIKLGLAAGGLLILTAAALGSVYINQPVNAPEAPEMVTHSADSIQGGPGCIPPRTMWQVLNANPLQAVPLLFSRHTLPAVAVTILLVVLVALAVTLPLVLQSTTETPVPVEPAPEPLPEPKPIIEPEPEPGFFSKPLNLGLIGSIVVLGLIVIAGVVGRAICKKGGSDADSSTNTDADFHNDSNVNTDANVRNDSNVNTGANVGTQRNLGTEAGNKIADITNAYIEFTKAPFELAFWDFDCFKPKKGQYYDAYIMYDGQKLIPFQGATYSTQNRPPNLYRYNRFFLNDEECRALNEGSQGPFILVMKDGNGNYMDCRQKMSDDQVPIAISLNPRELGKMSNDDLDKLLKFVQSLK